MDAISPRAGISVAALALLVSACQGSSPDGEDTLADPIPAEELEQVTLPEGDLEELVEVMGDQMGAAQTVRVNLSTAPDVEETEPVEQSAAQLRLSDPPEAVMTIVETTEDAATTTEVVAVGGAVYTSLAGEELAPDKPWVRLTREDIDAAEEELGMFADVFTLVLDEIETALNQAAGEHAFDVVRRGELDEEPGAHGQEPSWTVYQGRTSAESLADSEDDALREFAEAASTDFHWTLAVSEVGLPQEHSVEMVTPEGEEVTVTAVYNDWGKQIDVQAPPEEETASLEETVD